MASAFTQIFSGTQAASHVDAAGGAISAAYPNLGPQFVKLYLQITSAYAATAATTGVKAQIAYSIDGGTTFSDFADAGVTSAPTPSSGTAVTSTIQGAVTLLAAATHFKVQLVNKDGTNATTSTVCSYVLA